MTSYELILKSSVFFYFLVVLYLTIKMVKLQNLNIMSKIDDRVTCYMTFMCSACIVVIDTLLVLFDVLPIRSIGHMIFLFIISTYLSEALKARAFGYPAKRLSKIQRILMIAVSSIFGTVSIIAIFSSFFIDGWFNKSQITEYMSQMEFYTFCKNMISFSGNTTMRNIMLACFIVPAIISIVMILWFDISEKRSSRTLVNDVLFIPLIIAILLDSYNIITSWWFPFIIILLSVIVIYMNIIKEVSSMIIRSNSSNLSMRLIEKSLKILSKKEGCDENCKNQIDTIAEMMIRDPTISFNLKKKRSSKKESNIINMIFEKKDLMIRNLK